MGKLIGSPRSKLRTRRGEGFQAYSGAAFDLSTAVLDATITGWAGTGYGFSNPTGLSLSVGGNLLIVGIDGYSGWQDGTSRWLLGTNFDLSSRTTGASAPNQYLDGTSDPDNILFYPRLANSGGYAFARDADDTTRIARWTLAPNYSLTGAAKGASTPAFSAAVGGFDIDIFGTTILAPVSNSIVEMRLGSAFSPSSGVLTGDTYTPSDGQGGIIAVKVSSNGLKMYLTRANRRVTQHTLNSPWTLADGASDDAAILNASGIFTGITGIDFNAAQTRLFLIGTGGVQGDAAQYDGSII